MKKLSGIKALIAVVLCACTFLSNGAMITFAADATNSNIAETYVFGDLPYHTGYSEFGYYDAGYTEYTLKATYGGKFFDASAANYNLQSFDTWSSDKNAVTLSTVSGLEARNWQWSFAAASSVVAEFKSKINGTVEFDFSGVTLGGWAENWNSVFCLYRYNAGTGKVDQLARNFKSDATKPMDSATYNHTVTVKAGDIVFFEVGSQAAGRNLQHLTYAKIIVTPTEVNEVVMATYGRKLDEKVGGLTQDNYAESDWTAINGIVANFKAGSYTDVNGLLAAYDKAVADIDAITPDPLKDKRTKLINDITAFVGTLVSTNYTSEAWATITAAKDAFVNGAAACESESALQELYGAKMAEIKAVKAYKQTFTYLDYPVEMNANGYSWIEGEIFDTKLYAGTVEDLKEFDTKGSKAEIMYNSSFNAGYETPSYFVENWKWFIGYNMGVIVAYKAHADMRLVITNTYLADGHASNGWTEECALTYYIVRGESVKEIKKVNAPSSDADFGGTYYLKAGDMLYIEFNSNVINVGDVRNTEAPCGMKVEADSTAFNEELYAEQNNDLSKEVEDEIASKKAELESYYAGLTESDYSATNWLTLAQYIEQFAEKCEDEVETVEDVVAIYQAIRAEMEDVPTIAEAQAELQNTLNGYVAELQAEYDALVANNYYTDENKSALDKAFEDGKTKILASKSKTAGNQEKIKAIAAIKAIQASEAPKGETETKSCFSSLAGTMVMPLMAIACAIIIKKRKED